MVCPWLRWLRLRLGLKKPPKFGLETGRPVHRRLEGFPFFVVHWEIYAHIGCLGLVALQGALEAPGRSFDVLPAVTLLVDQDDGLRFLDGDSITERSPISQSFSATGRMGARYKSTLPFRRVSGSTSHLR